MLPIVKLTWNVSSDGQDILTCNSECIVNVHINRKPNKVIYMVSLCVYVLYIEQK